jgi:hypothetical protein
VRVDFGGELIVDTSRADWAALKEASGWWIEIPAATLRQVATSKAQHRT